jgi:hypothetical protein
VGQANCQTRRSGWPFGRRNDAYTPAWATVRLHVSAIGLGCWGMSHAYGPADERESLATLECALDRGINFLDTADVYGDGHNERLMARVLKARRQGCGRCHQVRFRGRRARSGGCLRPARLCQDRL